MKKRDEVRQLPFRIQKFLTILMMILVQHSFAQTGNVLALDGTAGSYMSIANHSDINIDAGESYTITCKIKTPATAANMRILAKRNSTGGSVPGYEFITSSTGQFGANLRSTPVNAGPAFSTATINNGQWRHISLVVDQAAGNSKIYVDGVLDKTSATWTPPQDFSNTVDLIIGADGTSTHLNLWSGQIDNIRLWNKAMTPTEVNADRSSVISGPTANLVACWDFDNAVAPTVPDVSGNNHPGMLNGNATISAVTNNMTYQSATLTQTELPVGKGDTNQRIIAVNVITGGTDNPIDLSALNFTMNGTTNVSDVTGIKVYYTGSSNRFNTNNLFSTVAPAVGTITATGTKALSSGNNYFWIAYDVAPNATEGNVLDATCEAVTVGGTTYTLGTNSVAGSRPVFLTHTLLFSGGDYGSANYRIPAIITAADGSLVTATDKRIYGSGDLPADIDIVTRRSTDNGQTWSAPITIADFGSSGASDPALVMDRNTGNLICFFATHQGVAGSTPTNPIRIQICRSIDNGITWSAPIDITNQVYGAGCSNPITSQWYAAWVASGRAHQLRNGRIVAAIAVRQTSAGQLDNFVIFSDNGGITWHPSTSPAETNGDEAKIVELNNGNVMMSIRNPGTRRMNISATQGLTWGVPYNQTDIQDPNCNGDFIRYSSTLSGATQNILLHSIPLASTRKNVTVLYSKDEGATWSPLKTIYPQASAYSSLTVLQDGTIGVYYECGEYESYQMYFARFSAPQLTTTLPVKIISFTTTCASDSVIIRWQTAQEINSKYFEIESSTDGIIWSKLGSVEGKGNSNISSNYVYVTKSGSKKLFRLKIVDKDGQIAYTTVSSANCTSGTSSITLYPNPVKDRMLLTVNGFENKSVIVDVTDMRGQKVAKELYKVSNTNTNITINVEGLSRGMYMLKVSDATKCEVVSFLKQ
jgi:hypothetical protein